MVATLVFALVFAAWHFASHDLASSEDKGAYKECEICRLNHMPVSDSPLFVWTLLLLALFLRLVIPTPQRSSQAFHYTSGARAPPLI